MLTLDYIRACVIVFWCHMWTWTLTPVLTCIETTTGQTVIMSYRVRKFCWNLNVWISSRVYTFLLQSAVLELIASISIRVLLVINQCSIWVHVDPYKQGGICGWNQRGDDFAKRRNFYSWNGAFWCILSGKGGRSDLDMSPISPAKYYFA